MVTQQERCLSLTIRSAHFIAYREHKDSSSLNIQAIARSDNLEAIALYVSMIMPIRHLVLIRFKPEASPEQQAVCLSAFAQLPQQIDGIVGFEQGPNISPEGLAKGFTHATLITFTDVSARDAYLPHPAHQAFVEQLKPLLEDVLVIDYTT